MIEFTLDGSGVSVPDGDRSLLDVLRGELGCRTVKDGCSPQGQCGCCTVLVDGSARVSCVTPARRVAGRRVTTLDGLEPEVRQRWADALCAVGGSQCGFCTPGIVVRLEGVRASGGDVSDPGVVEGALRAHLCRCTGWSTIASAGAALDDPPPGGRDLAAAARRATLEGGAAQQVSPAVALGAGGFAADTAPDDALVALADGAGGWVVGESLVEARQAQGKVQGRRTTVPPAPPLSLPPGPWARTLSTVWVDPAYLETDASWCRPGGEPSSTLANGGAFGAKRTSVAPGAARELADRHGRPVLVLLSREDTVRLGPKRPPVAIGAADAEHGVVRIVRCAGIEALDARGYNVEPVDVPGPPTSLDLRAAGVAEVLMVQHAFGPSDAPVHLHGGRATAEVGADGSIHLEVDGGEVLDEVVLRSYCTGAAHMALSWVTSEGLAVGEDGEVLDLTVRSFGVVPAAGMPSVDVVLAGGNGPPANVSDAAFVAVAAALWRHQGFPPALPTGIPLRPWR